MTDLPSKRCVHWARMVLFATLVSPWSLSARAEETKIPPYDEDRFEKTILASNLIQPMEMAVAPDGSIYLIELGGTIKNIDPNAMTTKVVGKIAVTTEQENGLIGIALDPQFARTRWMYLQYSPPSFSGQHISRFNVRPDGTVDMESEVRILKYEEQRQECCHHAGSMEFGPDGCLYIGTGDNTNPFGDSQGFAPIDERDGKGAFNALRTASNTMSHNGKVLRIRPLPEGGYAIPEGNLFPKDGSVGLPEIYVMGCRNPWRLNIDQRTGFLYWGDVGPDAGGDTDRGPRGYDEVNQARKAGYFGWPLFIGNNRPYVRVDFESGAKGNVFDPSAPINFSRFNTGSKQLPPAQPAWIYYPGGDSQEFPVLGAGGRTACAGPVYDFNPELKSTTKFPKEFDRTLFIFEWSRNWIVAVHLDAQSNQVHMERFLPRETFIRPIDLQFDAQGSLLVIEYGETWGVNADAKLVRIDYQSGNRKPAARIASSDRFGREPLTIRFSAKESSDKDKDPITYSWTAHEASVEGKAPIALGNQSEMEWTFDKPGTYNVQVIATDPQGASDTAVVPVVVGNSMPSVSFRYPKHGDFYETRDKIPYQVVVADAEDGTSDEALVASTDMDILDPAAPDRVFVQSQWLPFQGAANASADTAPPGLKLMRGSDCFNCHALDRAIVGPSFLDVANKYRNQPEAMDKSIERVMKGSTGVWGKVAMLPHAQYSRDQIASMVAWVYAAEPDPSSQSAKGMQSAFTFPNKPEFATSILRLTASYSDLGRDGTIPSLTGSTTIELRPRTREAESADTIHRMSELGTHNASNGKFLGAIDHGSYFVIRDVPLEQVRGLTFRVTSAGAGGDIVVHAQGIDGPELASVHVDVNGSWEGWYERSVRLPEDLERGDLYFVTINPKNPGGLMNIDWVRFDP